MRPRSRPGKRRPITWQQKRQQLARQQQERLEQQKRQQLEQQQQVLERQVQRLLLFCHKRTKQQQR